MYFTIKVLLVTKCFVQDGLPYPPVMGLYVCMTQYYCVIVQYAYKNVCHTRLDLVCLQGDIVALISIS